MNRKEQIEMLLETGISKQNIAETLNMSINEIDEIISPKQAKDDTVFVRKRNRTPKFDEENFNEAKRLLAQGWTYAQIAKRQGLSEGFLEKALKRETYADLEKWREKRRVQSAAYSASLKTKRKTARATKEVSPKPAQEKVKTRNKTEKAVNNKTVEETRTEHVVTLDDRTYIELRSIADSLARIAEAAESRGKKKGLFRR